MRRPKLVVEQEKTLTQEQIELRERAEEAQRAFLAGEIVDGEADKIIAQWNESCQSSLKKIYSWDLRKCGS